MNWNQAVNTGSIPVTGFINIIFKKRLGFIYQYKALNEINRIIYESESNIFYKEEQSLSEKYVNQQISEKEFKVEHNANFYKFALRALDAGIYIREVLWNECSQK